MKRDPAFVWETEALRRRVGRRSAPPPVPPVEPHDDLPDAPETPASHGPRWVTISEAAAAIGSPEATVSAWIDGGRVPAQTSEHGRLVLLSSVVDRAAEMRQAQAATPATPPAASVVQNEIPAGSMIVPRDAWDRMLDQLGNLHEAGQQLADARERAVKAETEAGFLRERLSELRDQLEQGTPSPAPASPAMPSVPSAPQQPVRRQGLLGLVARGLRRRS
ncbi:MAG: hypothetical protein HKN01_04695 [Acidimicrobiia bacterium]|nr:hypothetical protein [Acidimicrobiia bacterium]